MVDIPVMSAMSRGKYMSDVEKWKKLWTAVTDNRPELITDSEEYIKWFNKVEKWKGNSAIQKWIITLNFKAETDLEKIIDYNKTIEKICSKKWMKDYIYNWEFHNKKGEYSHPHVHIFCAKGSKKKSEAIREIYSTLKHIEDFERPQDVDIKYVTLGTENRVMKYVMKNKERDVVITNKLGIARDNRTNWKSG